MKRILVIQGHPDPAGHHLGDALAEAYLAGAKAAGYETRQIDVARVDFPLLTSKEEFEHGTPPPGIQAAQDDLRWADHVVFFYPLWLGALPARLKGFLEQVLRPGFVNWDAHAGLKGRTLRGKSAHVVVTMGMPAFVYRWYFGAHSLKALKKNILGFCGMRPIRQTLIGMVEGKNFPRARWIERMQAAGKEGR